MAHRYLLQRWQRVERPRAEVFAFFADAANLERITPPEFGFSILTPPPIEMKRGTILDYRLKVYGVPFRWKTLIEEYEPGVRFVDVQMKGPYKLWRHLHEFVEQDGATLVRDRLEYELPLGPLGRLAHAVAVEPKLHRIFDYRSRIIETVFASASVSVSNASPRTR